MIHSSKLSVCCMSNVVKLLNMYFTLSHTHTQQAEAAGEDYERVKLLETSAVDMEKKDRKRKKKSNPDTGFAGQESHSVCAEKL